MTEQLQLRRGAASQIAAFTGAQGELVVDTTNNRAVVNDGVTAGGWPAAKLAEVITNARTAVADAAYAAQASDRLIAYSSLSAARVVTLCAAAAYPTGTRLTIVDESGACSAAKAINVQRAGSDTISGATSAVISVPYGHIAIESNGAAAWTIVDQNQVVMTGDSGAGGAAGYAPAPAAGAAAGNQVLGASGGWVGQMVGFRNRLINGAMAIDQRNAGALQVIAAGAALAYTIDRFYAYCSGANVAGQRVSGSASDQYLYQFTGAASVTAIGFAQRIEAANSFDLAGTTATFSVKLANALLATVNWTAYYANSADTFGALASPTKTQIAAGSFAVNSTLTRYGAQITIPAAATTGIEIVLSVGAQTSGTWQIGEVQLEPGAVATPFERRPIAIELSLCLRYYNVFSFASQNFGMYTGPGNYSVIFFSFPPMRTLPSATQIGTWTYSNGSNGGAAANNNQMFNIYWAAASLGESVYTAPPNGAVTLNAEL